MKRVLTLQLTRGCPHTCLISENILRASCGFEANARMDLQCMEASIDGIDSGPNRRSEMTCMPTSGRSSCCILSNNMFITAVWSLVAVLVAALLSRLANRLRQAQTLAVLPAPQEHWLMGSLKAVTTHERHQILLRWAIELGGIYRIRLGPIQVSWVSLASHVLSRASGFRNKLFSFKEESWCIDLQHPLAAGPRGRATTLGAACLQRFLAVA